MTEEEAKAWVRERFGVPRETALARFEELLRAEAQQQNLIASSTLHTLWARHFVDSAQLIPLAEGATGHWIDIGSGAGLPGMVVAILTDRAVTLVEPRAKRTAFLQSVVEALSLADRVSVVTAKVENYDGPMASVVSARAVAELPRLFSGARHCTETSTLWLLPKGKSAHSEVAAVRAKWQGVFHVEPSITSPEAGIVVARGVRPR